jgi:tetratricopeptide (TPR) repeat protein
MAEVQENAVAEQLSKAEKFVTENRKSLLVIGGTIAALILIYFGYQNFIAGPREKEAAEQMFMAERYFEQDSLAKAISGDGNNLGFEAIVDEYGSTKAGNIAKYYLGFAYLKSSKYEEAAEVLSEFSSNDEVLNALALSGVGDAYTELNNTDEAISYYKKAAKKCKDDFNAPIILMKLGLSYDTKGEFQKAIEVYERIKKEYYESFEAKDIDKYIARATARLQ